MLDLGLSHDEDKAFRRALIDSHRIRVTVRLADERERVIESLTQPISYVEDGEIQVDATADVSRSLSLVLLDPQRKLGFAPDSAAQGSLYASRFVSVRYGVWVEELGDWVDVPVFFGPLTAFEHNGDVLSLEGQGKESLLLDPHFAVQHYTIEKHTRLDDAIKKVAKRAGERHFALPRLKTKMKKSRTVGAESEPWKVLAGGEEDANGKPIPGLVEIGEHEREIFYDGRGRLTVRRKHRNPVFKIGSGMLTEQPSITYDLLEFRNYVQVKGAKKGVVGHAALPKNHPLSPHSLGRNGEPRYLAEFLETDLKKDEECEERAEEVLKRKSMMGISASFSCLPIPHLEENDTVRLDFGEYHLDIPIKQFTIPLTTAPMTLGINKRVKTKKRKKHHHVPQYSQSGGGGQGGGGGHRRHHRADHYGRRR